MPSAQHRRAWQVRASRARWRHMSPADRAAFMAWARACRGRLEPAPSLPSRYTPLPCYWPASCEKCGSPESLPWLSDPARPHVEWRWRCKLHAGYPGPRPGSKPE